MKPILFTGCCTAIATPFDESGINLHELQKLITFQLEQGVSAIVVCGTTGESSTMSTEEKINVIKCAVKTVNKKIPVIVGTGCNNTSQTIKLSKTAENLGADGLLIVSPYYNKTSKKGLIMHFLSVANSVNIPIILYNVPSRTGINLSPEICFELSKINNIIAIKEASGDISQVAKIASLCQNNLTIYSGCDDQIIPVLSLGGKGVISVLSNIQPKLTQNIITNFLQGNTKKALSLQLQALPLIEALFIEPNPIPVKEALNILGYNFKEPRLPLYKISEANKKILEQEIKKFKN